METFDDLGVSIATQEVRFEICGSRVSGSGPGEERILKTPEERVQLEKEIYCVSRSRRNVMVGWAIGLRAGSRR